VFVVFDSISPPPYRPPLSVGAQLPERAQPSSEAFDQVSPYNVQSCRHGFDDGAVSGGELMANELHRGSIVAEKPATRAGYGLHRPAARRQLLQTDANGPRGGLARCSFEDRLIYHHFSGLAASVVLRVDRLSPWANAATSVLKTI
jgi:hypothetical protein